MVGDSNNCGMFGERLKYVASTETKGLAMRAGGVRKTQCLAKNCCTSSCIFVIDL